MTVPRRILRKLQPPTSNIQRRSKIQHSRSRGTPSNGWYWILVLGSSVDVGCCGLEVSLLFIHYPDDHPPDGTLFVADCFASGHAIGGNDHALVHPCAM